MADYNILPIGGNDSGLTMPQLVEQGAAPLTGKKSSKQVYVWDPASGKYVWKDWDYDAPERPAYAPTWDSSMSISDYIKSQLDPIQVNKEGLNQFRKEALRTGPSAWARLAEQVSRQEEKMARDRGAATSRGRTAEAQSGLAMRGGLTSGARERVARAGARDYMNMSQDIGAQGTANRMQVGLNDEQNRIAQLGQLPGMEVAAIQPDLQKAQASILGKEFDLKNQMSERERYNQWLMDLYKEDSTRWGTNRQAEATEKANSGSWLCTMFQTRHGLEDEEKDLLKKFLQYAKGKDRATTKFYLFDCKELVGRMKEQNANWQENDSFIRGILLMLWVGRFESAWNLYFQHVKALIDRYWPECDHPVYRATV